MRSASRWAALGALALVALGDTPIIDDPRAAATPATPRAAVTGATIYVAPTTVEGFTGTARACVTPSTTCTDLRAVRAVPLGRFVDARTRAVIIGPALDPEDPTSVDPANAAVLYGSTFSIDEQGGVVVAQLAGGGFRTKCGTTPPPSSAPLKRSKTLPQRSNRIVRALDASTVMALRVVGGYASATAKANPRTTDMRVSDRCGDTRVAATSGATIVATDLRRGTSTTVGVKNPYVAKAPPLESVPNVSNLVEPVSLPRFRGLLKVCKKLDKECQTVTGQTLVPIGAHVDTRRRGIRLETFLADGTRSHVVTRGARFKLLQPRPGTRLDLRLEGGNFRGICGRRSPTTRSAGLIRRERGSATVRGQRTGGNGRVRTTGKHGRATITATDVELIDRCDGTLVRVRRGKVRVFDPARGLGVDVKAPNSRLIRARR